MLKDQVSIKSQIEDSHFGGPQQLIEQMFILDFKYN